MKRAYLSTAVISFLCAAGCSDGKTDSVDAGQDLAAVITTAQVVINEVFPHGADELTDPDWAELKNTGTTTVDLSGYRVRDDKTSATLPAGTTIAAGAYLVIYTDDVPDGSATDRLHVPFKLGGTDEFYLLSADGNKVDGVTWDATAVPQGKSYGRLPDGTGKFNAITPSRGARNL